MKKMKMKEVYTPSFLSQFGENKDSISKIEIMSEKPYIDLDKIVEIMGIRIIDENNLSCDQDGKYMSDKKEILLNPDKPATRRRFTEAHEIGHAVLQHAGISWREIDEDDQDRWKEMAANGFAADLLMPRKLLVDFTEKYIRDKNLDEKRLTDHNINDLIVYLANQFGVSDESMGYRVKNVNLFVESIY